MRNSSVLALVGLCAALFGLSPVSSAAEKEWTMLVYLNGNNNLDSFGAVNIKQMETVGSTADLNIVVQWASLAETTTKRLLVQKSTDPAKVTSPIVQEMPRVDMGDPKSLVEFIRWGVENYPAKHYFLDVWNHGGGWHRSFKPIFQPFDISSDELSGNTITTPQLGEALASGALAMGHKIDLYGSDACLMGMAEVAFEVADSVGVYLGSEETEPGRGWPYDKILSRWTANPHATASEVGRYLTEEYVQSYIDHKDGQVTMSAIDLSRLDPLINQLGALGQQIAKLSTTQIQTLAGVTSKTQTFSYRDYLDIGDLVKGVAVMPGLAITTDVLDGIKAALNSAVIENKTTKRYEKATGLSVWLPRDTLTFDEYADKYKAIKFQMKTNWLAAVENLAKNSR